MAPDPQKWKDKTASFRLIKIQTAVCPLILVWLHHMYLPDPPLMSSKSQSHWSSLPLPSSLSFRVLATVIFPLSVLILPSCQWLSSPKSPDFPMAAMPPLTSASSQGPLVLSAVSQPSPERILVSLEGVLDKRNGKCLIPGTGVCVSWHVQCSPFLPLVTMPCHANLL